MAYEIQIIVSKRAKPVPNFCLFKFLYLPVSLLFSRLLHTLLTYWPIWLQCIWHSILRGRHSACKPVKVLLLIKNCEYLITFEVTRVLSGNSVIITIIHFIIYSERVIASSSCYVFPHASYTVHETQRCEISTSLYISDILDETGPSGLSGWTLFPRHKFWCRINMIKCPYHTFLMCAYSYFSLHS